MAQTQTHEKSFWVQNLYNERQKRIYENSTTTKERTYNKLWSNEKTHKPLTHAYAWNESNNGNNGQYFAIVVREQSRLFLALFHSFSLSVCVSVFMRVYECISGAKNRFASLLLHSRFFFLTSFYTSNKPCSLILVCIFSYKKNERKMYLCMYNTWYISKRSMIWPWYTKNRPKSD